MMSPRTQSQVLAIATIRLFVGLSLIWFARSVLVRLPFANGLSGLELPFTIPAVVSGIAYVLFAILLLSYARQLTTVWPAVFPRQAGLTPGLTALVYLLVITVGYWGLAPAIQSLADEVGLLLLQVFALVLTTILVVRACLVFFRYVPEWLAGISPGLQDPAAATFTCPSCGQPSPAHQRYCGQCGRRLSSPAETTMP